MLQNFLRTCKEGEVKARIVLDKALKEKFDREQTMNAIEEVLKELKVKLCDKEFDFTILKEMQPEINRMTREQLLKSREYLDQISGFENKLLWWSRKIFKKMAEESFEGNLEKRNDACAFFRAMIHVFQQPNFSAILLTSHPFA